ncbi:MAG: hypothetical protein ABUJ98_15055 [Hyphomicrobium sp.]
MNTTIRRGHSQQLLDHFLRTKGRRAHSFDELVEFASIEGNTGRLPGWDDATLADEARLD